MTVKQAQMSKFLQLEGQLQFLKKDIKVDDEHSDLTVI